MPNTRLAGPLYEAASLIDGDRQKAYGTPEENFGRWASMVSDYLGYPVTPMDMAMISALGKISRIAHQAKYDSFVDAAGYLAIATHLAGVEGKLVKSYSPLVEDGAIKADLML